MPTKMVANGMVIHVLGLLEMGIWKYSSMPTNVDVHGMQTHLFRLLKMITKKCSNGDKKMAAHLFTGQTMKMISAAA